MYNVNHQGYLIIDITRMRWGVIIISCRKMIKGTESVGRIKIEKLLARRDYNDLKSYYGQKSRIILQLDSLFCSLRREYSCQANRDNLISIALRRLNEKAKILKFKICFSYFTCEKSLYLDVMLFLPFNIAFREVHTIIPLEIAS